MAKASIKSTMNGAEKLIIFRFSAMNGWASGKFIATLDSHQESVLAVEDSDIFVAHSATMGKLNRDFEPLKMAT